MVLLEQLTVLIEFMECHTQLALGHLNRSKEGRSQTKRLWEECCIILNSVSADCVTKTPNQWRLYYNEYKSKLMKKIKIEKAEIKATGGGPSKKTPLTPLQERLYNILGRDFGEPLPGIRHNPLSQHDHVSEVEAASWVVLVDEAMPSLRPPSIEQKQELAEEVVVTEIPAAASGISRQQWRSREPPASTMVPKASMELALDTTASRECATGPAASTSRVLATGPIPSTSRDTTASSECATGPTASTSRVLATGPIPSTSRELPSVATTDPIRHATPAAPRRRRLRRRSTVSRHATENEPALRQATEHLEAMERLSAEATLELAQATHRQAAALESIGQVLRQLITQTNIGKSPRRRGKRIRVIYSSDSD